MRVTLHPVAGCGLALLFAFLGAQPQEASQQPAAPVDARVVAFRKSYQAEQDQDYAVAIQALRGLPPARQDYLVALRLGWLYYLSGDHAKAAQQYDLAASQQADSIEPQLGALSPLIAGTQYADVERLAKQVFSRDPQNYTANLRLAYIDRLQGKLSSAEQIAKKLSTLYPSERDFLIELALNLSAQGKQRDATPYYQLVLLVAPEDEIARRALANVHTTSKADSVNEAFRKASRLAADQKYAEAAAALDKIQPAKNQEYIYHARLGWLHYLAGNYDDSRKHYEAAVSAAPKAVEPLLGLLLPVLAQQQFTEAEEIAHRALKLAPANYYANLRLAYSLRMQERYTEAEAVNRQMLKLYPSDVTLLWEQALTLTGRQQTEAAADLYRQIEVLTPAAAQATDAAAAP